MNLSSGSVPKRGMNHCKSMVRPSPSERLSLLLLPCYLEIDFSGLTRGLGDLEHFLLLQKIPLLFPALT